MILDIFSSVRSCTTFIYSCMEWWSGQNEPIMGYLIKWESTSGFSSFLFPKHQLTMGFAFPTCFLWPFCQVSSKRMLPHTHHLITTSLEANEDFVFQHYLKITSNKFCQISSFEISASETMCISYYIFIYNDKRSVRFRIFSLWLIEGARFALPNLL